MRNEHDSQYATGSTGGAGATGGTSGSSDSKRAQLTDAAKSAAGDAREQATAQLRSGIDAGKQRAAGALHDVAGSLRRSCDDRQDMASEYLRKAGDRVERAANYIDHTDVREMMAHTEQLARRQPALFIGAAFTLGLAAARFFKSSQRSTADTHGTWQSGSTGSLGDRERPLRNYQESTGASGTSPYASGASSYGSGASYGGTGTGSTANPTSGPSNLGGTDRTRP